MADSESGKWTQVRSKSGHSSTTSLTTIHQHHTHTHTIHKMSRTATKVRRKRSRFDALNDSIIPPFSFFIKFETTPVCPLISIIQIKLINNFIAAKARRFGLIWELRMTSDDHVDLQWDAHGHES